MAMVDTVIRFNKFNSLILAGDETSWSQKFDVEFYSVLTVQTQALCLDGSTTGQFILRWLDEDGERVIDSTDGFDIDNRWVRKTATFAVPERAVEAMFAVKNTGGAYDIRIACAMAEAGEIASAFDPSLASQASYLDAHGLYTGTVTANQVMAGILLALTGEAWFDLEKPEIVMKGKDATWRASPENPLRLEDKGGNFAGGLVRLPDGKIALVSSAISNRENFAYGYGTVGIGPDGGAGYYFEHRGQKFILCQTRSASESDTGVGLYINNVPRFGLLPSGGAVFHSKDGTIQRFAVLENGSTWIRDGDGRSRLIIRENGEFYLGDGEETRFYFLPDGSTYILDSEGTLRYWQDNATTFIRSPNTKHAVGADNTGPFYIKNNSVTYF